MSITLGLIIIGFCILLIVSYVVWQKPIKEKTMEKTEVYKVDKAGWLDGPWMTEPDKLNWIDEATNLDCMIVRNHMGNLCGYVAVTEQHPWFGISYSGCAKKPSCSEDDNFSCCEHSPDGLIRVHGGLTYSNFCSGHICQQPDSGRSENVYWFGFDCASCNDITPGLSKYRCDSVWPNSSYKNIQYVKEEVLELAKQLFEISKKENIDAN